MKVYTKRGDKGETDLFGAGRTSKDSARVEAYGDVDELNAAVGTAAAASEQADYAAFLQQIQSALFDLGSMLATPDPGHLQKSGLPTVTHDAVAALEAEIDRLDAELPALETFILPGGTQAAAAFHVARTICRSAERRAVHLAHEEPVQPVILEYLNRLSDLLFVYARVENRRAGKADVAWVGRER